MNNTTKLTEEELRNTYPISTFRGTTQDELVEFIEGYANTRINEALDRLEAQKEPWEKVEDEGVVTNYKDVRYFIDATAIQAERNRLTRKEDHE